MQPPEMIWICLPQGLDEKQERYEEDRRNPNSYNLKLPNDAGTRLYYAEFGPFFKAKVDTTALSIKHIATAIPGTKSNEIISILINANEVNDRFHVQQVYNEVVGEIRIDIRHKLIAEENEWYGTVRQLGNPHFRSVIKTFKNNAPTILILNYFRRRATNATAAEPQTLPQRHSIPR